jgi:hypothetical protein
MSMSPRRDKLFAPYAVAALLMVAPLCAPALAIETSTVVTTAGEGVNEFTLDPDNKEHESERKEIEAFLQNMENQWNSHSLDSLMAFYADDYVNNDGLDKKAVSALTQDFWKTYPDVKYSSKTKSIRIEGNFATVESRDMAIGSTAKVMPVIGSKGDLSSISEGQLYIKKITNDWKIIGDRIDYEKVRVAFGLAKNLNAVFSAPEQVKSGNHYSAKLDLNLPSGLTAVGSITSQPLEYPQPSPGEKWRSLDGGSVLERIMAANSDNRNELLMATIGITNSQRSNLMGITFLTRRLNVVPISEEHEEKIITAEKPGKEIPGKLVDKSKASKKSSAESSDTEGAEDSEGKILHDELNDKIK